jgi:hypothetical protein
MRNALVFFAITAAIGGVFALVGPIPQMRWLGVAATVLAVLGALVELYALRAYAPLEYEELRERALRTTHPQPTTPVALGRRAVLGLRS